MEEAQTKKQLLPDLRREREKEEQTNRQIGRKIVILVIVPNYLDTIAHVHVELIIYLKFVC